MKSGNILTPTEKALASIEAMRAKVAAILQKARDGFTLDALEQHTLRAALLISYHGSGKIEGIFSVDSSTRCAFCQMMRAAAQCNPLMICRYCYADNAAKYKHVPAARHELNALILSEYLFSVEELEKLDLSGTIRFNSDGDIVNTTMARNYIRIRIANPAARCALWHKNVKAVEEALNAEGIHRKEDIPAGLIFIKSSPMIGTPAAPDWFTHRVFTVYPDAASTDEAATAGSWRCLKKCKDCGRHCYSEPNPETVEYIAEELKGISKKDRAAILNAWKAAQEKKGAITT